MDTLGIEPRAFCMRSGCTHPSNGHTSPTLRKWGRDDLAHGHTGDWAQGLLHAKRMYTSQQWPHESYTEKMGAGRFRAFFEQEHLSRIGVEKPPKSSRLAFSRVYCPPGPCANSGTDRQDTRPTNSTAETLSVEGAGGRKKPFSSQLTCSMLYSRTHWGLSPGPSACEADVLHPSNGHHESLHWENGGGMI